MLCGDGSSLLGIWWVVDMESHSSECKGIVAFGRGSQSSAAGGPNVGSVWTLTDWCCERPRCCVCVEVVCMESCGSRRATNVKRTRATSTGIQRLVTSSFS